MRMRLSDRQELLDAIDRALDLANGMALYGIASELTAGRKLLVAASNPDRVADSGAMPGADQGTDDWWADRRVEIEFAARALEETWTASERADDNAGSLYLQR